jgi:hypothetical protein
MSIGERYLGQRVLWWFNCSGISGPKYICIPMNRYSRTGEIAVTTHEYLVPLPVKDGYTKLSSKSPLKLGLALGDIKYFSELTTKFSVFYGVENSQNSCFFACHPKLLENGTIYVANYGKKRL